MQYKTMLFIFVLVVLSFAVFMAFKDIKKNFASKEHFDTSADIADLKIALFKADFCGHCKDYLRSNVFEDTYTTIKGKDNFRGVVFVTYDYDQNKQLAEQYNIESFPSIIAIDGAGNMLNTFDGDRYNKEDLVKFVEANRVKA